MAVLVMLATLSGCGRIETGYCALRLPPQQLTIAAVPLTYAIRRDHSIADLDAAKGLDDREGEAILGLTSTHSVVRVETTLHVLKVGGSVCARPSMTVVVGYEPLTVDIARELEPGSCREHVTLQHELKHVAAYRTFLPTVAPELRTALEALLPPKKIYRFQSVAAAQDYFDQLAAGAVSAAGHDALEGVRVRQEEIDTPEEYARVGRACPPQ